MFKKMECKKCKRKIDKKYSFCPYCGSRIYFNDKEEWGMLGRNDLVEEEPMPSFFGGNMLNKMLGSAMKMLEKEMQKDMKRMNRPNTNFRLMINGKEVPFNKQSPRQIKVEKKEAKKIPMFSEEKRKKFQKLTREEPKIILKRFPNNITYEIEMPGVKSLEDVSILKLENSIEIKAIGKKAYYKIIQVSLPIRNYNLSNEKLVLELGIKTN